MTQTDSQKVRSKHSVQHDHNHPQSLLEKEWRRITCPCNDPVTLSLTTCTDPERPGHAGQGSGQRRPSVFRKWKGHNLWKAQPTCPKFLQFSTSFANPSNALKVHQFSTNPNSSCHVFTSCSGLEMLEEKSQTQASGDIGPITRRAAGHFCPRTSLGLLTSREISGTLKDLWKWQRVHSKLRLGNVGLGERRRRPERRVWDDGPFLKGTSLAHGENFGSRSCRKRQLRRYQNPRLWLSNSMRSRVSQLSWTKNENSQQLP